MTIAYSPKVEAKNADALPWVRWIFENQPAITKAYIYRYSAPPMIQDRIDDTVEIQRFLQSVRVAKGANEFSFWDNFVHSLITESPRSECLYKEVLFHNGMGQLHKAVSQEDVRSGELASFALPASSGENYALSSRVLTSDGNYRHVAMIDFGCRVAKKNIGTVLEVSRHLFEDGFVLVESGGSYHGYGSSLQTDDARVRFLAKALLFAPIVDRNYIAHQLLQGISSLRISGESRTMRFCHIEANSRGSNYTW